MYSELILRPASMSDRRIFPIDARRLVAKAMDGEEIANALFGRAEPPQGRVPFGEFAPVPIIFDGGKGFIRIYGVGRRGSEMLQDGMGRIHRAVSKLTESATQAQYREGIHQRQRGESMVTYHIAKLGLAKPGKERIKAFQGEGGALARPSLDAITPMVKEIIDRGIMDMAMHLDREGGEAPLVPHFPHDLQIAVHEGEPGIMRIHQDRPGHVMMVRNLKFSMLGLLQGPWSVGHLRSHGCGMLKLVRGEE